MARLRPVALSLSILFTLIFSTFAFAAVPDRIGTPIAASVVSLGGSVHPQARSQNDKGVVASSFPLRHMTLVIAPSPAQQKAINKLLAEQQNRSSASYHKWLTPDQYAERFGMSQNDLGKITAWLKSHGFTSVTVGRNRNMIDFSGTAGQAEAAFQTSIHLYNVEGEEHFANATPLKIPAALSGIVIGVRGLSNFRLKAMHQIHRQYYDPTSPFVNTNFIAPGDVTTIYDVGPLYSAGIDGTGQTLAIMGQTDIYIADIAFFRSGFGLSTISGCTSDSTSNVVTACDATNFQYVLFLPSGGTDPLAPDSIADDLSEADLDIEWSGAVAQNAQVIYVNSPDPSGNGVIDSLTFAISPTSGPPVAPVISMSYAGCEAFFGASLEPLLQQANLQGQTVVNSSGDAGAAACDNNPPNASQPFSPAVNGLAVSYPASSPSVTAVGGTYIPLSEMTSTYWNTSNGSTGGSAKTYIPELAWNDNPEFATFCQANPSLLFCSQGGETAVPGWVPLGASATAAQVQEDIWINAGGGGASNCFTESGTGICEAGIPQPTWQSTLSVPSAPAGVRYVPDVAFLASANFPGYIFCTPLSELGGPSTTSSCANGITDAINDNGSLIGGTSVATPVFAGIVALMNQAVQGTSTAGLGNINPTLYALAATSPAPPSNYFNPVNSATNIVYCQPGTPGGGQPVSIDCPGGGSMGFDSANFDTTTHYNLVTGLGSVDANNLVSAFAALGPEFTFANLGMTSVTVLAGQSATGYSFTVTPTGSTGIFAAPISFGCSFSPSDPTLTNASCAFNPSLIEGGTKGAVNVTMTITTAGPNGSAAAPARKHRADNRSPWLPFTLPIAGILVAGFAGRKVSKHSVVGSLFLALVLVGFLVACGSSTPPISITGVSGSPASVFPNNTGWPTQTATITATILNDSGNKGVTWTASAGTIASTGPDTATYTAPTIAAGLPTTVTITATSVADTTKTGTGTENLNPATIPGTYSVTVSAIGAQTTQTQPVSVQVN